MPVNFRDPMRIHEGGRRQRLDPAMRDVRRWRQDLYTEAALFLDFAGERFLGVLIELDMPPDGKPFIILFMIDQKHVVPANNKSRDNKIVKLVNVRQGGVKRS